MTDETLAAAVCDATAVDERIYFNDDKVEHGRAVVANLTESGYSVVPTADLDRLRAVERAARAVIDETDEYADNGITGDESPVETALRAALGDRAAEEGHTPVEKDNGVAYDGYASWVECSCGWPAPEGGSPQAEEWWAHRLAALGDRAAEEGPAQLDVERARQTFHNEYEGTEKGCRHQNQHKASWDCQRRVNEFVAEYDALGDRAAHRPHNHPRDEHHWQDCPGCDEDRAAEAGR